MTDANRSNSSDCLQPLKELIRASVHETRNALNGVVVNLEVVRSRLTRGRSASAGPTAPGDEVLSFAEQAVSQAESSARLSEALGALLSLITASVDTDGRLRCVRASNGSAIRFKTDAATAERLLPRLEVLGAVTGFDAERREGEVIFTIPKRSLSETQQHE